MTTLISYHPLDCELALDLYSHTRALGLHPLLLSATESIAEIPNSKITESPEALVLILRPEYLHCIEGKSLNDLVERSQLVIPILRMPISIDDWAGHIPLTHLIDCTNIVSLEFSVVLKDVENVLRSKVTVVDPKPEELYINSLQSRLRSLCKPLLLLEHNNFVSGSNNRSPFDRVLDKICFAISKNGVTSTRLEHFSDLWKHCKTFILSCSHLDQSVLVYHLLNNAIEERELSKNAPIPVLLNLDLWDKDQSWGNWLSDQIFLSPSVIDDVASGVYSIYVYGSDSDSFLSHPHKATFEEWLWGARRPKYLIFFGNEGNPIFDNTENLPIVTNSNSDWVQIAELFNEFSSTPFSRYFLQDSKSPLPYQQFLLRNPILVATLLTLRFNSIEDITQLRLADYYSVLIKELMSIANSDNHTKSLESVEISPLLALAKALTTKQVESLSFEELGAIVPSRSIISRFLEAGILRVEADRIHFSLRLFQDYFAGKYIVEQGLPPGLPQVNLNTRYRRQQHFWDTPVIIATLLAPNKETLVDEISDRDPILALNCVAMGANVSAACYNNVIDRNVRLLNIGGDFRLDLALVLYQLDRDSGKAILLEVMRSALWEIRLEAFRQFLGVEIGVLSGLSEAITHLAENNREYIGHAIQRLGIDSLPTLLRLLHSDIAKTRENAAWALGELGDKAVVPALISRLSDTNNDVCIQSIRSLGKINDVTCVPYLVQFLQSNYATIRNEIGYALSVFLSEHPKEFTLIFSQCNIAIRQLIIGAIDKVKTSAIIDFLISATFDSDPDVKVAAVTELGAFIPNEKVITRLKGCLSDMSKSRTNKSAVSTIASRILGNLGLIESGQSSGSPQKTSKIVKERLLNVKQSSLPYMAVGIDHLGSDELSDGSSVQLQASSLENERFLVIMTRLRNGTWNNTSNAAKDLKEFVKKSGAKTSLNTINQILETLNDENWVIRWAGIEVLGWTGNIQVIPHLVRALDDANWKIRVAAIRALAEIGHKNAVPGLAKLLSDTNAIVREASAEALGSLGGEEALKALELAALDQEEFVRLVAIESLGKLRHPDTEKTLVAGLQDKSEHVRWAAANGLSGIANAAMLTSLIPSLKDTSGPYWEQKRICDVIIDILKQIDSIDATNAINEWRNSQAH